MTFYAKAVFGYYTWSAWRKTEGGGDIQWNVSTEKKLRQECGRKPSYIKCDNLRILFVGFSGYGKTTSLTNFVSALANRWRKVGGMYDDKSGFFEGTITVKLKEIPVTVLDEVAYFSFRDCPGISEGSHQNTDLDMVNTIISGTKHIDKIRDKTTYPGKPDCVVFVMDATKLRQLSSKSKETIGKILKHAENEDVALDVLLTKCDLVDTRLRDPSYIPYIFHSTYIKDAVENANSIFGIPKYRIHPVVNNTEHPTLFMEQKILQLLALKNILGFVPGRNLGGTT